MFKLFSYAIIWLLAVFLSLFFINLFKRAFVCKELFSYYAFYTQLNMFYWLLFVSVVYFSGVRKKTTNATHTKERVVPVIKKKSFTWETSKHTQTETFSEKFSPGPSSPQFQQLQIGQKITNSTSQRHLPKSPA